MYFKLLEMDNQDKKNNKNNEGRGTGAAQEEY